MGGTGKPSKTTSHRKSKVAADVHRHIDSIYHQLRIQLVRMAQIQAEVDELRAKIRHLF
jgi:hypothetical protein